MQVSEVRPQQPPSSAKTVKGTGIGSARGRRGQGTLAGGSAPREAAQTTGNKLRVTIFKLVKGEKLDSGKALILPETWGEFLKVAAKKLNVNRIESVETEDGTIVEELNEIMQGDKLMVRCKNTIDGAQPPSPPNSVTKGETERTTEADSQQRKKLSPTTTKEVKPTKPPDRTSTDKAAKKKRERTKLKGREGVPGQEIDQGIEEMQKNLIGIISENHDASSGDADSADSNSVQRPHSMNPRAQLDVGREQSISRSLADATEFDVFHLDRRMDNLQGQFHLRQNEHLPLNNDNIRVSTMGAQTTTAALYPRGIRVDTTVNGSKRLDHLPNMPLPLGGHPPGALTMMQPNHDMGMLRLNGEYPNLMLNSSTGQFVGVDPSKFQGLTSAAEQLILQQQALILAAQQMNARQEPGMPQNAGRRSHEQARFSPLVQVLRDHMVHTSEKKMPIDLLKEKLTAVLPDWQFRLNVSNISEYIHEAAQAGLVNVQVVANQQFISVRGDREVGIVKWVKESYGFIQSAAHAEDLFYHSSEVRAARLLAASDEVEFLVVRNPFTGKLNATQIYLLRPNDPPPSAAALAYMSAGAAMMPAPNVENGMADDFLSQLTERMMSLGFSPDQIEDTIRAHLKQPPSGDSWDLDDATGDATYPQQDSSVADMLAAAAADLGGGGGSFSPPNGTSGPFNPYLALALSASLGSKMGGAAGPGGACAEPNKEPWLFKTKMCKFWPSCPRGTKCWFAHGDDELRKPNSVAFMLASHLSGGGTTAPPGAGLPMPPATGNGSDPGPAPMGSLGGPMGSMGASLAGTNGPMAPMGSGGFAQQSAGSGLTPGGPPSQGPPQPPHGGHMYAHMDGKDSFGGGGMQWTSRGLGQQQGQMMQQGMGGGPLDGAPGFQSPAGGGGGGGQQLQQRPYPSLGGAFGDSLFWAPSGPVERPAENENFFIPSDFMPARRDSPTNLVAFDPDTSFYPYRSAFN